MKDDRRKQMAAYIAKHQTVTMAELCNEFKVSINTVRTDVATLTKTGVVEKVYGGVCSTMQQEVPMFTQRTRISAMHSASRFLSSAITIRCMTFSSRFMKHIRICIPLFPHGQAAACRPLCR